MIKRQIFIDTETTGLSADQGHRIVELAAVEAISGQITGRIFHTYLNPERSIEPAAERVHGLSSSALAGKPTFVNVAKELVEFIRGAECLMHNASFDAGFINTEFELAGLQERLADFVKVTCTMQLAKSRYPGERVSLDALIQRAGLCVVRHKHSALDDARLLADVYFKALKAGTTSRVTRADKKNMVAPVATVMKQSIASPEALIGPEMLCMKKAIELVEARKETFFYRNMDKRIIEHRVVNHIRWEKIAGPLVYAVTDKDGVIRYVGKWVSETALYSRWMRHKTIHHQERARNLYITELDSGNGPLSVWSISVREIRSKLPLHTQQLTEKEIAAGLEALWIHRWRSQLNWNDRKEHIPDGFCDGEYWKEQWPNVDAVMG